ncbi:MAG: hypothetical protein ACR2LC_04625 [Pyrinomonadaceae bacterium]
MTPNSKILSVALAAAVLGGSAVALVNHSGNTKQAETAPAATLTTQPVASTQTATDANLPSGNLTTATTTQPQASTDAQIAANTSKAKDDQGGYREGYTQGLQDARGLPNATTSSTVSQRTVEAPARVVTRTRYVNNSPRYSTPRYRNSTAERRAYYDYSQPRQRTFWQKHRDKLTVGGGTVGGALLGGIIGGKKGAAIGALSGAGGSALYTYKIRNKNRRY